MGGRPTNLMQELRKRAREKASRLLCNETEECIRFLIYVRDNPNVAMPERVRCALELLNRGEVPAKTASYLGTATPAGDLLEEPPKLVVLGRFPQAPPGAQAETNGRHSETNGHEVDPNGDGAV